MPDENPYHSPQVDSTPHAVAEDVTLRRRPTWRLWVLALIGLPALIWLCFVLLAVMLEGGSIGALLIPPPIAAVALLIYAGSIVFVLRNWNPPSRSASQLSNRSGFIYSGLIILTIIAVPSAFFCTCTPIAVSGGSWSYFHWQNNENMAANGIFVSIAIGVIVGIICTILTIRLAYNLWRDAVEGLPKSTERETIITPIARLQAKKPGADNS